MACPWIAGKPVAEGDFELLWSNIKHVIAAAGYALSSGKRILPSVGEPVGVGADCPTSAPMGQFRVIA